MKKVDILIPAMDLANVMCALNNVADPNLRYSATEVMDKSAVSPQTYRGVKYLLSRPNKALVSMYLDGEGLEHILETVYQAVTPGRQKDWNISISSMDALHAPKSIFPAPELQH